MCDDCQICGKRCNEYFSADFTIEYLNPVTNKISYTGYKAPNTKTGHRGCIMEYIKK